MEMPDTVMIWNFEKSNSSGATKIALANIIFTQFYKTSIDENIGNFMVFFPDFTWCLSDTTAADPEPEPYHSAPKPDQPPIPFKADPIPGALTFPSPEVSDLIARIRTKYPDLKCTFCSMVSMTSTHFVSPVLLKVHQIINDETTKDLIEMVQKYFPSSLIHLVIEIPV